MESNSHAGGTKRRRTAGYNKVYFSWYYVKLGSLAELELFKKHSAAVVAVSSLNMHAAKRPNTPFWSSRESHPLHAIILPYPHTRCSPIKQLKCRLQRHSSSYSRLLFFSLFLFFFFFFFSFILSYCAFYFIYASSLHNRSSSEVEIEANFFLSLSLFFFAFFLPSIDDEKFIHIVDDKIGRFFCR